MEVERINQTHLGKLVPSRVLKEFAQSTGIKKVDRIVHTNPLIVTVPEKKHSTASIIRTDFSAFLTSDVSSGVDGNMF